MSASVTSALSIRQRTQSFSGSCAAIGAPHLPHVPAMLFGMGLISIYIFLRRKSKAGTGLVDLPQQTGQVPKLVFELRGRVHRFGNLLAQQSGKPLAHALHGLLGSLFTHPDFPAQLGTG